MATNNNYPDRRNFLKTSLAISTMAGIAGTSLLGACKKDEEEVSPAEDLMREHGILNRILLIYDFCGTRLVHEEKFSLER